jgi:hypothetical protein
LGQKQDIDALEEAGTLLARDSVKKAEEEIKPKAKKLREKLLLREATEALDEQQTDANKPIQSVKKTRTKKAKVELIVDTSLPEELTTSAVIETNNKNPKKTRKAKVVDFEIVD